MLKFLSFDQIFKFIYMGYYKKAELSKDSVFSYSNKQSIVDSRTQKYLLHTSINTYKVISQFMVALIFILLRINAFLQFIEIFNTFIVQALF